MKRPKLRSALLTSSVLLLAGAFWLFVAPTAIGGFNTYVVTHGVSMEPRFHSGDLAIVRPASRYAVGEIVAYRSSLLHLVVLHRIVAIHNGHFTFKGDNNHFLDPVHPTRAALVGTLWLHIPHGGIVLEWLHRRLIAALLAGLAGLLLVAGSGRQVSRRRRRPRQESRTPPRGAPVMRASDPQGTSLNLRALLLGTAAVAAVLLAITVIAFTRPTDRSAADTIPYTQSVHFSYHAAAPTGPVYPTGVVTTGQPIFLSLVRRLGVDVDYRLTAAAPPILHGTAQVVLKLAGPTGWSRSITLDSRGRFSGSHTTMEVSLDLAALQSMVSQIEKQTGVSAGGYTVAVALRVHVHGLLDGHPVDATFDPQLPFELEPLQMQVAGGSAGGSTAPGGATTAGSPLSPRRTSRLVIPSTAPNAISALGASVGVTTLRLIAPVGFLIALASGLLLAVLVIRSGPFGESARIQAKYGHIIVPINAGRDLGWPAIDVGSMKALVRLAETSGQLILHSHDEETDTYLVNDEGSVYRYTVQLPKVVWGEWTAPTAELTAS